MKFWIGVTDNSWYKYLSNLQPDEVNFWQPGATGFRALEPGEPYLFKLHHPDNYIAGGGFFVRYTQIPLSLAWDAFGEYNGAPDYRSLYNLIMKRKGGLNRIDKVPLVGCIILNNPFFFPRDLWIKPPGNFSKNIVRGKTYDTEEAIGRETWHQIGHHLAIISYELITTGDVPVAAGSLRYGEYYMQKARFGQGTFRVLVTDAYNRRCSITGERTLPALDAAHIKPYAESGPNRTSNGLLLRSDIHKLFDKGYITVTSNYRVEVSRKIKEEFENGRDYYAFHGNDLIVLPQDRNDRPSIEYLKWHNEMLYKG
jgi:putative restriction endonuclease